MKKRCSKCFIEKDTSLFLLRKKNGKINQRAECKDCTNKRRRELYDTKNREKILERNKKWILKNIEYKKEYDKERQQELKSKKSEQKLINYHKRKSDALYRIKRSLRARLYFAVKNNSKFSSTIKLLGCTMDEFKAYLESKFKNGMNWNNYGFNGWHIDHIVPCASFDLTKPEQQKKCFHYTNLQPLWAIENLKKGARQQTNYSQQEIIVQENLENKNTGSSFESRTTFLPYKDDTDNEIGF